MWTSGHGVGKTQTPKGMHVVVCGMLAKKSEVRRDEVDWRGGTAVEYVGVGMERFDPKRGWKVCVDEEHTEYVVGGAYEALSFPVLW